jgi:hypothetical protein
MNSTRSSLQLRKTSKKMNEHVKNCTTFQCFAIQ